MSNLNAIQRLLGAAGLGLALCAAALPATAQDAVTVTRDATTGQLRPATAEEQAALQAIKAKTQARVAPKPTLQKFHSSGAAGVRLTDEFLSSSTAVRTPDGKIDMICNEAHSDQPAAAHVHAAANTPVTE